MSRTMVEQSPLPSMPSIERPKTPSTSSPNTPPDEYDLPLKYSEPLYTEIRLDLPPFPKLPSSSTSKSRSRAHTITSFLPSHRRSGSSPPAVPTTSPPRKSKPPPSDSGNKGDSSLMKLGRSSRQGKKRSTTIGALAVAPAVMILKAELFTPQERKDDGSGRR
ncbi:hypothetical protein BU24DRAFT_419771 [Aaosphaeria arxii CBS 175.79]|uniref:Uncharacterized protein n=1 Tax=Aaosphaeria arxii CBS 175.79 TaxID=1450172 RepID=A0A6A5Y4L3_9PLEO|nr:uncharacterized protein BU24DRAFT_419771 [Aaosphaeria arxii CBS 175.79]KAF2020196.1 hypothetical protein BU24DRAFT_419771 [Aaosphaeria arxii CBS 175.79]